MIKDVGLTSNADRPFYYVCRGFGKFWTASIQIEGELTKKFATGEEVVAGGPYLSFYDHTSRHEFFSRPPAHRLFSIWLILTRPHMSMSQLHLVQDAPGAWSLSLAGTEIRDEIIACARKIHEHWRSRRPYSPELAENMLEHLFLLLAHEQTPEGKWIDPRSKQAIDFMRWNFRRKLPIDEIANEAHLSASRFTHLFVESVGCPPSAYLEQLRMDEAKSLLLMTTTGIAEISHQLGYDNQFYFSNRFHHFFGTSPTQFRKKKVTNNQ